MIKKSNIMSSAQEDFIDEESIFNNSNSKFANNSKINLKKKSKDKQD